MGQRVFNPDMQLYWQALRAKRRGKALSPVHRKVYRTSSPAPTPAVAGKVGLLDLIRMSRPQ